MTGLQDHRETFNSYETIKMCDCMLTTYTSIRTLNIEKTLDY